MAIRKSSRTPEYTAMPQDITNGGTPVKNGGPHVTTQTYVDMKAPKDAEMPTDEMCGWGPFKPGFCQRFRDPKWVLFWLCWAGAIQGMVVNGFVNVVISNIEKRYDLSSTESGTIASCYDIASVLCLIPVSYFGGLGCKPRYLGIGVFIMGVGSIVFSLPQFTAGPYKVEETGLQTVCQAGANSSSICDTDNAPETLSHYKYVFFLGQLLHGAGAAPLYTVGVTYLDENLPLRSSSFYIGIFYALAIVGPAIGYLAGGAFLDFYVDLDKVDTASIALSPDNPRWVGAWWIGFIISGVLAFIVALPIAGFPKSLPGAEAFKAEKEKEVYSKTSAESEIGRRQSIISTDSSQKNNIYKILKSVKILVTNPTFMFLNLAAACEGNLLSGFATFTPKFIEAQFALPASTAAQYVGYAAIPAGGGGTFLGGYLVKRFNLRVRGIIRMCLGLMIAVLFLSLVFLVHCQNLPFAGVNVKYGSTAENNSQRFYGANMTSACNQNCQCSAEVYNPVCGIDGILYYSPCFAGCLSENKDNEKMYSNCSCVTFDRGQGSPEYEAIEGKCASTCELLPVFMPFFGLVMLLTFVASMPALSATLRCVPMEQRSFALGIQWIIARCLGSIPGPILFGKLIDITCELWQTRCNEQGSCFFYDNKQMSYNMLTVSLVGKFLSALFFFCALMLYKAPPGEDDEVKDSSTPPPTSLGLSPTANCKSNQSVHTAVTTLSENSTPATTPATPNGEPNWSRL